jgi:hypothetical protein
VLQASLGPEGQQSNVQDLPASAGMLASDVNAGTGVQVSFDYGGGGVSMFPFAKGLVMC